MPSPLTDVQCISAHYSTALAGISAYYRTTVRLVPTYAQQAFPTEASSSCALVLSIARPALMLTFAQLSVLNDTSAKHRHCEGVRTHLPLVPPIAQLPQRLTTNDLRFPVAIGSLPKGKVIEDTIPRPPFGNLKQLQVIPCSPAETS